MTLDVLLNSSLCAQHPARPNNTKMSESGAEKILLQGHARKWVARAAKPFYKKGEEEMWSVVANFLVSDPLFFEVRS